MQLVLERVERAVRPGLHAAADHAGYRIHRVHFEVPTIGSVRAGRFDQVFRPVVVDADGVGRLREQIDDGRAVQPHVLPSDHRHRLEATIEGDRDFNGILQLECADRTVQAKQIHEQEPLLEPEVLLEQPIA